MQNLQICVFDTAMGCVGIATEKDRLCKVAFTFPSIVQAERHMRSCFGKSALTLIKSCDLKGRLRRYFDGAVDDFLDVKVIEGGKTPFLARVVRHCREIPAGSTLSYGDLAAMAGSPHAARAVGNCMAANPTPIVVPCHRVVYADGSIGHYSATGGRQLKERLLELEGALSPV